MNFKIVQEQLVGIHPHHSFYQLGLHVKNQCVMCDAFSCDVLVFSVKW